MKTSTSIVALVGLFSMVLGGAIPSGTPVNALESMPDDVSEDTEPFWAVKTLLRFTNPKTQDFNALSTPCQQCSKIYTDCRKVCS